MTRYSIETWVTVCLPRTGADFSVHKPGDERVFFQAQYKPMPRALLFTDRKPLATQGVDPGAIVSLATILLTQGKSRLKAIYTFVELHTETV